PFLTAPASTATHPPSLHDALPIFAEKMQTELQRIHLVQVPGVHTTLEKDKKMPAPPYYGALYTAEEARKNEIILIGLEITPIYIDRKSTRLNSSHVKISYAVFCLK